MADTEDLKSSEVKPLEGSSPSSGKTRLEEVEDLARRLADFIDRIAIYPHDGQDPNHSDCTGCNLVVEAQGLLENYDEPNNDEKNST